MASNVIIPDFEWYSALSSKRGPSPRCPFASVERCPRYYQSLSLLGGAGFTKIDPKEDASLLRRWKRSDLWPRTDEQGTTTLAWTNELGQHTTSSFLNFCPEVTYDAFGYFASAMSKYADELDRDLQHQRLGKMRAPSTDWRWGWAALRPMHYSECPLYSPLSTGSAKPNDDGTADVTVKIPLVADIRFKLRFGQLKERLRAWAQWVRHKELP